MDLNSKNLFVFVLIIIFCFFFIRNIRKDSKAAKLQDELSRVSRRYYELKNSGTLNKQIEDELQAEVDNIRSRFEKLKKSIL